jgi:hypothetical protein
MIMIRHTLFGLSLLALSSGVALAAPAKHVHTRAVAEATTPAGDTAAPADGKAAPAKKEKKAKKEKAPKAEGAAKEMKAAPTPAK